MKKAHEAILLWVEDFPKHSFKICIREAKVFSGPQSNIKIVSVFYQYYHCLEESKALSSSKWNSWRISFRSVYETSSL